MQSIFAIKDVVSKKETREIAALCGVTVTQVREYFASQRSRVRTLVRLSREKVINSNGSDETGIDCPLLASGPTTSLEEQINHEDKDTVHGDQVNCVSVESADACAAKEETLPGIEADDDKFLKQIFGLMKKESTFSGQMKLMEWILQIHNSAVLLWFLTKGGLSILAKWLAEAAVEEQTTVILAIFKVLCHLPLHKARPVQMSAILQTVNKLRFYRTSDISNKARVLLSRWSKLFVRSQGLKRPPIVKYASEDQKEMIRRQRICEILSDGSWESKIDLPEDILALSNEGSDHSGTLDYKKAIKMLPATCNESTRKSALTVACPKTKEKRKVLLVEQPDSRNPGRSIPVARAVPVKGSRPMSSDDIQKAKMHAIFMQRKYRNTDAQTTINPKSSSNVSEKEVDEKSSFEELTSASLTRVVDSKPTSAINGDESNLLTSVGSTSSVAAKPALPNSLPSTNNAGQSLANAGRAAEKGRKDMIYWQTPPAVRMSELWSVGGGESSKEMDVQTARIRREQEAFYGGVVAIPPNPKEPWDMEMDFDDSLTPEIPTEPPPDADADADTAMDASPVADPLPPAAAAVPDLELLAVLLKNPQLVFALTSGQSCGLSNSETVALLDVLKHASGGIAADLTLPSTAESLPSPTPASNSSSATLWEKETPALLPPPPPLLRQAPQSRENITRSHHLQHHPHRHRQIVPSIEPVAGLAKAEVAAAALLPTPPRAQPPLMGRWPNGLREFPNERDAAVYPSGLIRQPLSAAAGGAAYPERALTGEAWSPDRSIRPLWDGHVAPDRSWQPGGRWRDRNRRL
ncbi:homeodomain-like superfamily protein isoform X2 [Wolffia australiana]